MKQEYDFSQSVKNPYLDKLDTIEKQVTLELEKEVITYFEEMAEEMGIPYQNLISLYLKDCARSQHKLSKQSLDSSG
jgi:predicted DNA binding CopG/RHH family protein